MNMMRGSTSMLNMIRNSIKLNKASQHINFRRFVASKHSYSSVIETEMPSITTLSQKGFNLKDHKKYQNMLLANTQFYCKNQPLLGIKKDGSISEWALMKNLTNKEFDVELAFKTKSNKNDVFEELERAHKYEAAFERFHDSIPDNGILEVQYIRENQETKFNNNNTKSEYVLKLVEESEVDSVLNNIMEQVQGINNRNKRLKYYTTSVLRKRRLKMNKHKYKKLRKRTRALRKKLNK